MFELAWTELLVIGLIVLIVVGPKDLPKVLRTTGMWVRRAQTLAREFQGSLEDMAREAELDEARKTVESASGFNVRRTVEDAIDPDKEMAKDLSIPSWGDPAEDDDDDPTGPRAGAATGKPAAAPAGVAGDGEAGGEAVPASDRQQPARPRGDDPAAADGQAALSGTAGEVVGPGR